MEILGIMSKRVRIVSTLLIVLLLSTAIFISCSDDIILEPLPSLLGDYEGRYFVTENVGSISQITHEYVIRWRFSDQGYWFFDDLDQGICTPSGAYTLTGEVELNQRVSGETAVCNREFNPEGVFSLRQPNDSVILTQQFENVRKEIQLVKSQ